MEMGSEFHREKIGFGLGFRYPVLGSLVFSGRTAIETVLREMPWVRKAILPSYCCDSMVEPFRRAGMGVCFYPVNYEDGLKVQVDIPEDVDLVLWCNYFGFKTLMPDMDDFLKRGGVIIEDITHSFLSDKLYHQQSHYLIASLRKWEPINCGGYCAKVEGKLQYEPTNPPPENFIKQKTRVMELKTEYLEDLDEEKKLQFLQIFGDSNHWLAENYSALSIDSWSQEYLRHVDVERQKMIRRSNAHVLYKGLDGLIQFLFSEEDMDCPLFVPVLLEHRDQIRQVMIDNKIYCPVHWPKPDGCNSNLYDMELSLICDQRYGEEDMMRIVKVLKGFL
ncbi:MAG: hypothetical protein HFH57_16435 [Lachnospiraceae bacterium]|nr:hypothetical protein [Lachnospiraceae bacterium]